MKKALLIGFAMLFVASTASAGLSSFGLYTDDGHSVCSVTNPGGFFPFTMWFWINPGTNGVQAAEFMLTYPAIVIGSTVTQNPLITVALGSLPAGISVAFGACNPEGAWVWTHSQACYLTATTPDFIRIVAHPTAFAYQVANCDEQNGYPLEAVNLINHLALNQACVVATEDATWGSIKSLF